MPKYTKRIVKTPSVTSKAFDLNKFIGPRVHKRASIWWPPQAWLKMESNHVGQAFAVFSINPTAASGTVVESENTGSIHSCLSLNSAKPYDVWDNHTSGDSVYGKPIAPLDILSHFYNRGRVTSADVSVKFYVQPSSMVAYTDSTIQKGIVRIGCFLAKSRNYHEAWSTDVDVGVPTASIVNARIAEAYKSGLLTTVPLTISNLSGDMYNHAELVMRNVNIMNQFQREESSEHNPDPATFSYRIPRLANTTIDHVDIPHPDTQLFMHFFLVIDKPLSGFAGTTEDSAIDIRADVQIQQNHLFTDPVAKTVEDRDPDLV